MKRCMLTAAVALGAFALFGAELTWKGGGEDSLTDPANWEPAQAPAPGDVLNFNSSAEVGAGSGAIDVGAAGLTFNIAKGATLTSKFKLSGDGGVTKNGAGLWHLKHIYQDNWTVKGDVVINDGELKLESNSSNNNGSAIGAGEIVINRAAGVAPLFHHRAGQTKFKAIRINGPYTANQKSISWNGSSDIVFPIYSLDDDFLFHHDFGRNKYMGGIYAGGHTMYVDGFEYCPVSAVWFDCRVEASLVLGDATTRTYYLNEVVFGGNFRMTDPNMTITIRKVGQWKDGSGTGNVAFYSGSVFYGKLITTSECPEVVVQGSSTFVRGFASLELDAATKFTINDGKTVVVNGFKQGETTLALGKYAWDEGAQGWVADDDGALAIIEKPNVVIYTGPSGVESDWQDPACWANGRVPAAGDYVMVEKTCGLTYYNTDGSAKEFDISEGGITLEVGSDVCISVKFTGTGALTKEGSGTLYVRNGKTVTYLVDMQGGGTSLTYSPAYLSTYTGGTYILKGTLNAQPGDNGSPSSAMSPLGTGPVYIVRQAGVNPVFRRRTGATSGYGPFYIQGPMVNGEASILWNSESTINFAIHAEDDFGLGITYGAITYNGPIYAHGHTMKLAYEEYSASDITFNGMIDASIVIGDNDKIYGMRYVTFGSSCIVSDPDSTITASRAEKVTFNPGVRFCGTYVNKSPNKASQDLLFKGAGTYVKALTVEDATKLTATDATVTIGESLTVGEMSYTEGSHVFAGGTFTFGAVIDYNFWTGAEDNFWDNPANWSRGVAPKGGDWAVFSAYVPKLEATEGVDITGDLTIEVIGPTTIVDSLVRFEGDGALIKEGAGRFSFGRQDTAAETFTTGAYYIPPECYPTYTGHTIINDGTLFFFAQEVATPLHLPYVEINRAANTSPMIYHRSGRCDYDEIRVTGAYVANRPVIDVNGVGAKFGPVYATDDIDVMLEFSQVPFTSFYLNGKTAHFYGSWSAKGSAGSRGIGVALNGVLDGDCIVGKESRIFGSVAFGSNFSTTGSVTILATSATDDDDMTKVSVTRGAKMASLAIANTAVVNMPANTSARVASVTVDGTALAAGTYTAENYGDAPRAFITGEGALMVGPAAGMMFIVH